MIMGLSSHLPAAGLTTITMLEKAEVEPEVIMLGKISRIKGNDAQLIKKLQVIEVARSPLPGKSRQIDDDYVRIRLRQNGIDLSEIQLEGMKKVEVSRSFIEISKEEIAEIVSNFVYRKVPRNRGTVRVNDIRVSHAGILPKGSITYKITHSPNMEFLGTIALPVIFKVNGEVKKKIWTTANIEIFKEVVVTKKPLRRHYLISEDDIYMKKMNLANLSSSTITSFEEVLGKRTRRKISSNVVLRNDLVELPPLVKRGDVVAIIAVSDSLRIRALGEVKQKGHRGEKIKVENLASEKEIYARVIDSHTVKVDF